MYGTGVSSSHGHRSVLQAVFVARMRRDTHYLKKIKVPKGGNKYPAKSSLGINARASHLGFATREGI